MAQKLVKRSNGEIVQLQLESVDRPNRQVVIDIPQYNARFIFTQVAGEIKLATDGREELLPGQPATTHVSRSVYAAMARWAGAILNDRR